MYSSNTAYGNHICKSDSTTKVSERLAKIDPAYRVLYQLGCGTGAELHQLLELPVEDVLDKDHISMKVGPRNVVRTFNFPKSFRDELRAYIGDRRGMLFVLRNGLEMDETEAAIVLSECGVNKSFLQILLRRYYDETGDIEYPKHMMKLSPEESVLEFLV